MDESEYMEQMALDIYMEEKQINFTPDTRLWRELPTAEDWLI